MVKARDSPTRQKQKLNHFSFGKRSSHFSSVENDQYNRTIIKKDDVWHSMLTFHHFPIKCILEFLTWYIPLLWQTIPCSHHKPYSPPSQHCVTLNWSIMQSSTYYISCFEKPESRLLTPSFRRSVIKCGFLLAEQAWSYSLHKWCRQQPENIPNATSEHAASLGLAYKTEIKLQACNLSFRAFLG